MRRQDRKISDEETVDILRNGEFGVLSVCTNNNEGYGVPLNYVFVNNEIFFHCAPEGSKLDFIRINNNVSFCVVGKTELLPSKFGSKYESAIVAGTISLVEGEEKREGLMRIVEKYSSDYIAESYTYIDKYFDKVGVLKLSIKTISGKARK